MARSTWVAHVFEWEKLLKCHLKGKASKKLANGQNIDYSEKRKWPKGFICPCTGVINTIIFKHVYWYMQQTQVSVYRTIGPLVLIFAQNIDCGYMLEPLCQGGSNEYPQSKLQF